MVEEKKKKDKNCVNCLYLGTNTKEDPCLTCEPSNWKCKDV